MIFAGVFLVFILALFSQRLQAALRSLGGAVLIAPLILTAIFAAAAASLHCLTWPLIALVAIYTAIPTVAIYFGAPDILAILLLWLPLEFAAGATFVPRPAQGTLHAAAYGVAISLALVLFLIYRGVPGMKYALPRGKDLRSALIGYAVCALVLIPLGLWTGFLTTVHAVRPGMPLVLVLIFVGTALPEEILFRALIQNAIVRRWGESNRSVAISAVIFGAAHLNNGPQPFPNWRYAVVATVAGFIFGLVFQRSGSVVASALVHTGVDATKKAFF